MTYDIDSAFADLDTFYPGSKRKRRDAPVVQKVDEDHWSAKPIIKLYRGVETEFYYQGALAKALGKSAVTLRLWERKGYFPQAPFRLPGRKNDEGLTGKRLYTRELIEIAVEEFSKRGLLDNARVEWKYLDDLTIALFERWNASLETAN